MVEKHRKSTGATPAALSIILNTDRAQLVERKSGTFLLNTLAQAPNNPLTNIYH
jgi:hypothetical protein